MNDVTNWKIPKWPFLLGDGLLLGFAYYVVCTSPHPISRGEIFLCVAVSAIGAAFGCLPFILDYRMMGKLLQANALGSVAEKIQNLEKFAAQVSSATNQWARVQEIVQANADKTAAAAKEIADRMAEEVKQFSAFMEKMNDSEKAALRLEVEKARRGEAEWLQTLVRILDHIFALHAAAARSSQPKVAEQIEHFQSACRGVVRRVGLAVFVAEPDKPFDPERHQVADGSKPTANAVVGETVGTGYTFQGKLLRPAIVRLKDRPAAKTEIAKLVSETPETE